MGAPRSGTAPRSPGRAAGADVLIVVPTMGQRVDLLRVCLGSLLAQDHPVQVVVVAGANVDTIEATCGRDPRVTVIVQQTKGLSAAINEGWRMDRGRCEFLGWLGDDDALPPGSVAAAASALRRHPRASMVHGRCAVIDGDGRLLRVARNGWAGALLAGYGVNLIAQPGCLFRSRDVEAVGGLDESLRLAMDVDLYARLRRRGPVVSTAAQLGVFREHDTGLSTDFKAAASAEARSAVRHHQHGLGAALLDGLAVPISRMVARLSALRPGARDAWIPGADTGVNTQGP